MSRDGFAYAPDRHRAVLDVLVHRMRVRLDRSGEIARRGESADERRLSLVAHEPLVIPDVRCTLEVPDLLLRVLTTRQTSTAEDAAHVLALPLRTVQRAIQQLVSDGACLAERQARKIVYRLEDTTFKGAAAR